MMLTTERKIEEKSIMHGDPTPEKFQKLLDDQRSHNSIDKLHKKPLYHFVSQETFKALLAHERLHQTELSKVTAAWDSFHQYKDPVIIMVIRRFVIPKDMTEYELVMYRLCAKPCRSNLLGMEGFTVHSFPIINEIIDLFQTFEKLFNDGATAEEKSRMPQVNYQGDNAKSKVLILLMCFGPANCKA